MNTNILSYGTFVVGMCLMVALFSTHHTSEQTHHLNISTISTISKSHARYEPITRINKIDETVKNEILKHRIMSRYKHVSPDLAEDVVKYAAQYAKPDFPKQEDLIAVIAVESSFNPKAKSKLKVDPALGLTQIRPGAWKHKLSMKDLVNVEGQIKHGADILYHNYKRVNSKALALHAYNLGLTATLRGERSKTYVVKYKRELAALTYL